MNCVRKSAPVVAAAVNSNGSNNIFLANSNLILIIGPAKTFAASKNSLS